MKHHKFARVAAVLLVSFLLLAGCGNGGDSDQTASGTGGTASTQSAQPLSVEYSEEDLDADWNENTATSIELGEDGPAITGEGAQLAGNILTISQAGTYYLTGTWADGQIVVDAGKDGLVRLVFDGVSIHSSVSAPVYVKKAKKTIVTLTEGSQNILTDAGEYHYDENDEPNACLFSKSDLTINGSGSLEVTASYHNGIASKDNLVITGGVITVAAVNDALRGKDSVAILDGVFHLTAGADGIKSNNSKDPEKGYVSIDGGTFAITAGNDGFQAETVLQITGGTFTIETGGGADTVTPTVKQRGPGKTVEKEDTDSVSAKALKAGTMVYLSAGSFVLDSADDAVHSNGDVTVAGGKYTISTGDDAMHADDTLSIEDGEIDILTSYEGLEGAVVDISGGIISIVSSDDGINASNGESSGEGGWPGGGAEQAQSGVSITISGGTITIDASGDAIDSNGDLNISGGEITLYGPANGPDVAVDYDGTCTMTGGILLGFGNSGMAQAPGEDSTQYSLAVTYSESQSSGTEVVVSREDGTELLRAVSKKQFNHLVVCIPDFEEGNSYFVAAGDTQTVVALDQVTTTVSDSGEPVSSFMQGGFGGKGSEGGGREGNGRGPRGNDNALSDEFPEGIEPPDGFPEGMELPDGFPEGMELPDGVPDDREPLQTPNE